MAELPEQLRPKPGDVTFSRYRHAGDDGCLCSRCLLPISERTHPIVYFAESGKFVFRYHPSCLGILDDDIDDDWYEEGN